MRKKERNIRGNIFLEIKTFNEIQGYNCKIKLNITDTILVKECKMKQTLSILWKTRI